MSSLKLINTQTNRFASHLFISTSSQIVYKAFTALMYNLHAYYCKYLLLLYDAGVMHFMSYAYEPYDVCACKNCVCVSLFGSTEPAGL